MPIGSDNDVIQNLDLEQLPGSNEIPGNFDVCLRWRGIATRMIMRDQNRVCAADYRQAENLTRMHQKSVHGPC